MIIGRRASEDTDVGIEEDGRGAVSASENGDCSTWYCCGFSGELASTVDTTKVGSGFITVTKTVGNPWGRC